MKISVIIPTYNSEEDIERAITSLLTQTLKPHEIIVVDGGSTDSTTEIAGEFRDVNLIINHKSHRPGSSRNLAADIAEGDVLFFFDSDCIADGRLLEWHIRTYERRNDIVGVKGSIRSMKRGKVSDFVEKQLLASQWTNLMPDGTMGIFHAGTNFSIYREVFLEMKFREDFISCEDTELFIRLRKRNLKVFYEPRAFLYHRHPDTLEELFEQRKWYGEGIYQLVKIHGRDFTSIYPLFSTEKYMNSPRKFLYDAVFRDNRLLCDGCRVSTLQGCKIEVPKLKEKDIVTDIDIHRVTCLALAAGILKRRTGIDYRWRN